MSSNYPRRRNLYRGFLVILGRDHRWDVCTQTDTGLDLFAENFGTLSLACDWIDREWPEGAPK